MIECSLPIEAASFVTHSSVSESICLHLKRQIFSPLRLTPSCWHKDQANPCVQQRLRSHHLTPRPHPSHPRLTPPPWTLPGRTWSLVHSTIFPTNQLPGDFRTNSPYPFLAEKEVPSSAYQHMTSGVCGYILGPPFHAGAVTEDF